MILDGRRVLVTGVLSNRSLAFHVAKEIQEAGGEVILTSFGRALRLTRYAAEDLPRPAEILELDVADDTHFDRLADELAERWDALDGVLHAVAYAPPDVWSTPFEQVQQESLDLAARISVFSLNRLVSSTLPLLERSSGASVVALTVAPPGRLTPAYAWMGVLKASLDALAKQLALQLGPRGVRVNLTACGPVRSLAGRGVPEFESIAEDYRERAPLGWATDDYAAAAGATCFLLSDLARSITGMTLIVDGGMHIRL